MLPELQVKIILSFGKNLEIYDQINRPMITEIHVKDNTF
jgi:hypothetical protein